MRGRRLASGRRSLGAAAPASPCPGGPDPELHRPAHERASRRAARRDTREDRRVHRARGQVRRQRRLHAGGLE